MQHQLGQTTLRPLSCHHLCQLTNIVLQIPGAYTYETSCLQVLSFELVHRLHMCSSHKLLGIFKLKMHNYRNVQR